MIIDHRSSTLYQYVQIRLSIYVRFNNKKPTVLEREHSLQMNINLSGVIFTYRFVCECMCVMCVCSCMWLRECVCECECVWVWVCVYMYVCLCICMYWCVFMCISVFFWLSYFVFAHLWTNSRQTDTLILIPFTLNGCLPNTDWTKMT